MKTQEIKLHGGPLGGQTVAIQEGLHFFRIVGEPKPREHIAGETLAELAMRIETRSGGYSRVGSSSDFEWDGWEPSERAH